MNNLINKQQYSCLHKRSTTTNLTETLNDWMLALNDEHSAVAAYTDYSKVFDTVCHSKLIQKLEAYGIGSN
jgi:hypothetical protein